MRKCLPVNLTPVDSTVIVPLKVVLVFRFDKRKGEVDKITNRIWKEEWPTLLATLFANDAACPQWRSGFLVIETCPGRRSDPTYQSAALDVDCQLHSYTSDIGSTS